MQEAQEKARQVKTYFQPYTCFQKLAMVNLFRQNMIPDCVLFYKHWQHTNKHSRHLMGGSYMVSLKSHCAWFRHSRVWVRETRRYLVATFFWRLHLVVRNTLMQWCGIFRHSIGNEFCVLHGLWMPLNEHWGYIAFKGEMEYHWDLASFKDIYHAGYSLSGSC